MSVRGRLIGGVSALLALGVGWGAWAQAPGEEVARKIAAEGNGKGAASCATCHGDQGQGMVAGGFPRLAGLEAAYLKAQLLNFQQDNRKNPVMAPMAKALSAEEVDALATFYAGLPAPTAPASDAPAADAALVSDGEALARYGRWSEELPACVSCHGQALTGLGVTFPALAGQPAAYVQAALREWKARERKGDPNDLMGSVARRLSERDIEAVSAYLATLPAKAQEVKP